MLALPRTDWPLVVGDPFGPARALVSVSLGACPSRNPELNVLAAQLLMEAQRGRAQSACQLRGRRRPPERTPCDSARQRLL
jgi:hypothetical protein